MKLFNFRATLLLVTLSLCAAAFGQDQTKSQSVTVNVVTVGPLSLSCPLIFPSAKVINGSGLPYKNADGSAVTCTASGGTVPYKWSISSGALPTGLTLVGSGTNNATGTIGGTPAAAAVTATVTIQVADSTSTIATIQLQWKASPTPDVTAYNLYRGAHGGPYIKIGSVNAPSLIYQDAGLVRSPARDLFYVATAVDSKSQESLDSNEATAHLQ